MSISLIWVVPSLPVKVIFAFDEGERLLFESSFFPPRELHWFRWCRSGCHMFSPFERHWIDRLAGCKI